MYDTIYMTLSAKDVVDIDILSEVPCRLERIKMTDDGDQIYYEGHLKNLKVNVSHKSVRIKGSLAKYYFGNNFQILSLFDTKKAIKRISNELQLPIERSKVTQLHFGINIVTSEQPKVYYSVLGDCKHFEKFHFENTLMYSNINRKFVFYDKVLEARNKRLTIPQDWKGKNVLRFELRYMKKLNVLNNGLPIFVKDLCKSIFYIRLLNTLKESYESIYKIRDIRLCYDQIGTVNNYFKYSLASRSKELGYNQIVKEIDLINDMGGFNRPEYSSRLKNDLKDIIDEFDNNTCKVNPLVDELNNKILAYSID